MPINDDTLRLARGMRVDLNKVVDVETRALVRAWALAWDELAQTWSAAIDDLIAASVDGQWPSRAQVVRAERTIAALDASRVHLERLARDAGARITQTLPEVTATAAAWEARLIATQMPSTAGSQAELVARFDRVDGTALDAIVRRTTEQITSLSLPLSTQATAAMHAVLVRGVALGDNPRTAARAMLRRLEGAFNGGLTRALVVARTEMLDAHRTASRAQDLANLDTVTGWRWLASLDARTCPSCLAMHGSVHPPDEAGPNDHQQGRCARVPVTKSWRDLGIDLDEPGDVFPDARAWFDAQPAATQRAIMGPARLDLLKSGKVSWDDLATRRTTAGWRDSYAPTPVKDLQAQTAGGGARIPPTTSRRQPAAIPDPPDADLVAWKARQDAIGLDFHGDTIDPWEVRSVERFIATERAILGDVTADQVMTWIPRSSTMASTNDFRWIRLGGLETELKSTKDRYGTILGRINTAQYKARTNPNGAVVKANFVVDITDHGSLTDGLREQLQAINLGRRDPISRLWVMHDGTIEEIVLRTR